MPEQTKNRSRLTTTHIIMIVGILVIVAAIVVVGGRLTREAQPPAIPTPPPAAVTGTGNVVLDDENTVDSIAELNRKAREGTFEVKMNSIWTFPDGKSPSPDAYVANSQANHLPIYFTVALADGEVIYTSPELPVGSAVKDIVLEKPLAAGNYECVCTYNLLNEDKTIRSSVSVVVRLGINA